MGARQKLNQKYFNWSLFLAATLGVATRSFLLFLAVLITMPAMCGCKVAETGQVVVDLVDF